MIITLRSSLLHSFGAQVETSGYQKQIFDPLKPAVIGRVLVFNTRRQRLGICSKRVVLHIRGLLHILAAT